MRDEQASADGPRLSRRSLLAAAGASATGVLLLGDHWESPARAAGPVTTYDGTVSRSMAMHIHSSFSEGPGSMEAHLLQARENAVDVLWWTDHDHRMQARSYRDIVRFTSLTDETGDGDPWVWSKRTVGSLAAGSGGVEATGSPGRLGQGKSLALRARSTSSETASLGFQAETQQANFNDRGNLYGQTWSLDVLPDSVGPDGYLELLLISSYHAGTMERSEGSYRVSYRFGGSGVPGTRTPQGRVGVVNVAMEAGSWNTVSVTPCDDIAALWPDMDSRDFSSFGISLRAVSNGAMVRGNFDRLRFERRHISGDVPLETQQSVSAGYAMAFPAVTAHQGIEMSTFQPHVNWFGGAVSLPDYSDVTKETYPEFMAHQVAALHAAGGLASYNHPYGSGSGPLLPEADQDAKMSSVAATLLADRALGCDIIEVGYPSRAGVDLAHHVGLWDILSRNGRLLTGNGTSDDHTGQNWADLPNNWTTSVWAPSTRERDLLHALAAGRAWTSSLSHSVTLDLRVDDSCPMGSVSVSTAGSRRLEVFATGIPSGGHVTVLRGEVDYAGSTALEPNTEAIASYPDTALASGSVRHPVDCTTSCFVRTVVRAANGIVVALSNPVWLLRDTPSDGIPAARSC